VGGIGVMFITLVSVTANTALKSPQCGPIGLPTSCRRFLDDTDEQSPDTSRALAEFGSNCGVTAARDSHR
jgi:hypothetical protein